MLAQRFRSLLRLAAAGVLPVALCFLAWIRWRTGRSSVEDEHPLPEKSAPPADAPTLACGEASASLPANAKEQKLRAKASERQRRSDMTPEEKEEERLRREAAAADKFTRKQRGAVALLGTLRDRLADACVEMPMVLAALDVEAWEQDGTKVTEIGLAMASVTFFDTSPVEPLASEVVFRHRHLLIHEHLELRNGKHVEDNKDGFLFGDSEVLHLSDAALEVAAELNSVDIIVGHAVQGDLAWLRKIGVTGIDANSAGLQARLVDTQTLAFAAAGFNVDSQPALGLSPMAEAYGLNPQRLHNGANDAAFTLQVMLSQCGVIFSLPNRSTSQHKASPEFQSAWVEALTRLDASQINGLRREEELRSQVAEFAALHPIHEHAMASNSSEGAICGEPAIYSFTSELTPGERKLVHNAAEEMGLQSRSTNEGPDGRRCVSIFRAADGLTNTRPAWQGRTGKRPKMKRSQWKHHCKAVENERAPSSL